MLFVICVRVKQQDRLFLPDSGEVIQISIRNQPQRAVGVGGEHVVRIHDRERIGQHQALETIAIGDKQVGKDGVVMHWYLRQF